MTSNVKPKIFIGSSKEAEKLVFEIEKILLHRGWASVYSWVNTVDLSDFFLSSFIAKLDEERYDYGVFILSPDDKTISRGKQKLSARDNVLFEAGILIGRLGYKNVFFLTPEDFKIKIPSDILGLRLGTYDNKEPNLEQRLLPFCAELHSAIVKMENKKERDITRELACTTWIKILNVNGDAFIKEKYRINSSKSICLKYVEISSHSSPISLKKLNLQAANANQEQLHIQDVETDYSKKTFLIHVPIKGTETEYEYSFNWIKMFPKKKESFTLVLHADENEVVLECPEKWTIRIADILKCYDMVPIKVKIDQTISDSKNRSKVYKIIFNKKNKGDTAKIIWSVTTSPEKKSRN
jgi:hypothetical protein